MYVFCDWYSVVCYEEISRTLILTLSYSLQIVMLDNFEPSQLKRDAETFKHAYPHVLVEASGGITSETMGDYLCDSVDIISQGKLTQGYDCLDYSLKIIR